MKKINNILPIVGVAVLVLLMISPFVWLYYDIEQTHKEHEKAPIEEFTIVDFKPAQSWGCDNITVYEDKNGTRFYSSYNLGKNGEKIKIQRWRIEWR